MINLTALESCFLLVSYFGSTLYAHKNTAHGSFVMNLFIVLNTL